RRSSPAGRGIRSDARLQSRSRRSMTSVRPPTTAAASRRRSSIDFSPTHPAGRIVPPFPLDRSRMRAAIVALGDLGRSARMLYHAHALAARGVDVDLVGFEGTSLPKSISTDARIHVHRLNPATLRLAGRFTGST